MCIRDRIILSCLFMGWLVALFFVAKGAIAIEDMVEEMRKEYDNIQT